MAVNTGDTVHTGETLAGALADILAGVVRTDTVGHDSHFFDDLGANSLVMAHFCAKVRKHPGLPPVSMKDVYRYPTISGLATALLDGAPVRDQAPAPVPVAVPTRATTGRYVLCGLLQVLAFLGYSAIAGLVVGRGYEWVSQAAGPADVYARSVVVGSAAFAGMCLFPIGAKWILVGRWKSREFPVWGAEYFRLWVVKVLLHANPIVLFAGNPLFVLYLRALGAKVGRHVTFLSPTVPVCTDLLTIGDGTVVRRGARLLGYRAQAGRIQTGRVTLGRDAYVGEQAVLDIDTAIGDGSRLAHASALHTGVTVPPGEYWHGSPAQRAPVDAAGVPPVPCGTLRRALYGVATVLQLVVVYLPLGVGGLYMLLTEIPALAPILVPGAGHVTSARFYLVAFVVSLVTFFGVTLAGLTLVFGLARLLNLLVRPDRVYPLYGLHYSLHRAVTRLTNVRFYLWLVGDSSYVVHYLRALGYDLSRVEQTGSNFGTMVRQDTPYLTTVGTGTMVADGLAVVNADYSGTSFRVSRTTIGPRNFLGNGVVYPAQGRTGDNCLLATKVMVPLDGPVREGVGLLGSPAFEIPRSVERDTRFDHFRTGEEFRRRLSAKNRYNLRTMGVMLALRWLSVFGLTLIGLAAADLYDVLGGAAVSVSLAGGVVFTTVYFVLVERCLTRFRPLRPRLCSIYEPYFWWHERLWKVPETHFPLFNGTPLKTLLWRMLGVRIGRRVFDDGCHLTERTLVTIGDDCTLNPGSEIQCHSQEDGTFKSDRTTLGSACTLGVGALVHYGVTVGDGAEVLPDSFVMKGEEVPARARWGGNPATEVRRAYCRPV